jgi:hypothetical protein
MPRHSTPLAERFWSKVDRSGGPDACWPWTGRCYAAGYGQVGFKGRTTSAHRVALELSRGRPPKHLACHTCDNPPCCNPRHLYDGTASQNAADAYARGRGAFAGRPLALRNRIRDFLIISGPSTVEAIATGIGSDKTTARVVLWRAPEQFTCDTSTQPHRYSLP